MNFFETYGATSGYSLTEALEAYQNYEKENPHLKIKPIGVLPCKHRSGDNLYFDNYVVVYTYIPNEQWFAETGKKAQPPENKVSEPAVIS